MSLVQYQIDLTSWFEYWWIHLHILAFRVNFGITSVIAYWHILEMNQIWRLVSNVVHTAYGRTLLLDIQWLYLDVA